MPEYEIDFGTQDHLNEIIAFIRDHWNHDHVFVRSPKLFTWQYFDPLEAKLNFVVARRKADNSILGILGYIPVAHFDTNLKHLRDYWLALWKVRDDAAGRQVGLPLLLFFEQKLRPLSVAAIGISEVASRIYKALGFRMGQLEHLYFLNETLKSPQIVGGYHSAAHIRRPFRCNKGLQLNQIREPHRKLNEYQNLRQIPTKTTHYYLSRYASHPFYKYDFFAIHQGGVPLGFIVTREVRAEGSIAIRVVDFSLSPDCYYSLGFVLRELVHDCGAEFADIYCHGFVGLAEQSGLAILKPSESQLIIPNHFEPLVRVNINLLFAYRSQSNGSDYHIVKGDSDQDRPNAL
jgi:hypothetical protein